ncbi:unnamed protein product, partial [Linum tenue]
MQRLLPLAIRRLLPKEVCEPLIELSAFFRELCCKTLQAGDLDDLQTRIVMTLCKLEMIFPPSFFDVMVHLCIHLPMEAKIAGPVQTWWMYPVERFLRTLKSYVRNKAHPEASIAEAYIGDECLTFCSRYIDGVDTKFNRPRRNNDESESSSRNEEMDIFDDVGRPLGKEVTETLDPEWRRKAHLYVLNNCKEVWPFIEEFKARLPPMKHSDVIKRYNSDFPTWLRDHVTRLKQQGHVHVTRDLHDLASGPIMRYKKYTGYIVNGYRFHTLTREQSRKSQNSGVLSRGDDSSPQKEYYGILEEVWELEYIGRRKIHLFKCEWFDVSRKSGYTVDEYSIMSVR